MCGDHLCYSVAPDDATNSHLFRSDFTLNNDKMCHFFFVGFVFFVGFLLPQGILLPPCWLMVMFRLVLRKSVVVDARQHTSRPVDAVVLGTAGVAD